MDKLTKQEEEVMQAVWRLGSCGVKEIVEQLPEPTPPYTTVASVVSKLKSRRFLRQLKDGKAYRYEPAVEESDYKKHCMTGFVHDYFRNSFKEMVTFFAKDEKLSAEDLQDIINEIEQD
ncbi:MAG: BlaI/MecI/CopY family transcriptional regulator [Prevotella sp.]|nr:BlaI/MecI/CopY family transcriptional regulator [Prevotella sp.]